MVFVTPTCALPARGHHGAPHGGRKSFRDSYLRRGHRVPRPVAALSGDRRAEDGRRRNRNRRGVARRGVRRGLLRPQLRTKPRRTSSPSTAAAVGVNRLAGDVARVGAAQEAHEDGDLLGLPAPADERRVRGVVRGRGCRLSRVVSIRPGETQLTVIWCGARSCASARVSPTRPALAAITCARPRGAGVRRQPADVDDGAAARARSGAAARRGCTDTPRRASRPESPATRRSRARRSRVSRRTLALFTRMSRRPNASTAAATSACGLAGRDSRRASPRRGRPAAGSRPTTASGLGASVRALTITAAPARASSSAMARPMLRALPVTIATRPASARSATHARNSERLERAAAVNMLARTRAAAARPAPLSSRRSARCPGTSPRSSAVGQRRVRAAAHVRLPVLALVPSRSVARRWPVKLRGYSSAGLIT